MKQNGSMNHGLILILLVKVLSCFFPRATIGQFVFTNYMEWAIQPFTCTGNLSLCCYHLNDLTLVDLDFGCQINFLSHHDKFNFENP